MLNLVFRNRATGVGLSILLVLTATPALQAAWTPDNGALNELVSINATSSQITTRNNTPYVVWNEALSSIENLHVKYFDGANWTLLGSELSITANEDVRTPDIAFVGNIPYVVWNEQNGANYETWVKFYNGSDWENPVSGNQSLNLASGAQARNTNLAVNGSEVYVSWTETDLAAYQAVVKRYNGVSWASVGGSLNIDINRNAEYASIAAYNGTPYVAFTEQNGSGIYQLYVKNYNGASWNALGGSLNNNPSISSYQPKLAFVSGTPHVIWRQNSVASGRLFVKAYNGSSWVQLGNELNVDLNYYATFPTLAAWNGTPYAGFQEWNGSATQAYVKTYNGAAWELVGSALNLDPNRGAIDVDLAATNSRLYASVSEFNAGSRYQLYVYHISAPGPTPTPGPPSTATPTYSPTASLSSSGALAIAYPNPAKDQMQFRFSFVGPGQARLLIYNPSGELVTELRHSLSPAGGDTVNWALADIAPGVYIVRVIVDGTVKETLKVGVIK